MTSSKIRGFQTPYVFFAIAPLDDVIFYQPPPFPKVIFGKNFYYGKI